MQSYYFKAYIGPTSHTYQTCLGCKNILFIHLTVAIVPPGINNKINKKSPSLYGESYLHDVANIDKIQFSI